MRTAIRVTAGVATAALLTAGCASGQAGGPAAAGSRIIRGTAAKVPAASARPYAAADTAFGLDLLSDWCQADSGSNLVFSPASLATGLTMAYLGAAGSTAGAMARVLHLPAAGGQALEAGLAARTASLNSLNGGGVTVARSDQVWADPKLVTSRGYLNAVATAYGAGLVQTPLLTKPAEAASQIDHAISAATRGQIPRLLTPDDLGGIGWVLTDALYLHADWQSPFDPGQTSAEPFRTATGAWTTAKYLRGGAFHYATSAGWTAVRLPYRGGKLTMLALLPGSAAPRCPALSPGTLGSLASAVTAHGAPIAAIGLPKVSLRSNARLDGLLTKLGMGIAFTGSADFSKLSAQACCIGLVKHAATLRVGEWGTVASAATAVGIEPVDGRPMLHEIDFDRPYLMLVTVTATGEPLFVARVASPS